MYNITSFVLLLILTIKIQAEPTKFRVIREWRYLNFTWPSEEILQTAMAKGLYIPENNIIAGISYFDNYYYLTLPRMHDGVPATLVRIPSSGGSTAPLLEPYPSWQMNTLHDCNAIQNAQNIEIDSKGQLWIIDIGKSATITPVPVIKCPPKLVIHNVKLGQTTTVFQFPQNVASRNESFLYDLVVDETNGGYAYITDNSKRDPGIIVFSLKLNKSWKIRHTPSMRADPNAVEFQVDGVGISQPINIAGIALGPRISMKQGQVVIENDRTVYYSPISSKHLYAINSSILRNEMNANNGREYEGFVKDVGLRNSQSDGMIVDNQGVLYYGLLESSSIVQWNTHKNFDGNQEIISKDKTYIQWPNAFTFDGQGNLIALTNRLQKFVYGKMDLNEENFRLLSSHTGTNSYLYGDDKFSYNSEPNAEPEPEPTAEPTSTSRMGHEPKSEPEPTAEPNSTTSEGTNHVHFHRTMDGSNSHGVIQSSSSNNAVCGITVLISTCIFLLI